MNSRTKSQERLLFPENDDKNAVIIVKILPQLGCVSQDSDALVSFLKFDAESSRKFSSAQSLRRGQAPSAIKPEEEEFVVDSGASMHMVSRKDLNSAELDTV